MRAFDAADYSDTDSEEELDGAEGKAEASSSGAAAKIARKKAKGPRKYKPAAAAAGSPEAAAGTRAAIAKRSAATAERLEVCLLRVCACVRARARRRRPARAPPDERRDARGWLEGCEGAASEGLSTRGAQEGRRTRHARLKPAVARCRD